MLQWFLQKKQQTALDLVTAACLFDSEQYCKKTKQTNQNCGGMHVYPACDTCPFPRILAINLSKT